MSANNTEQDTATPGPWRVGDAGSTVFGPPNGNPSPKTVARVLRRPDARLIAAAPELLEALRLLFNECTHYTEGEAFMSKIVDLDTGYGHEAWKKARAAIAKAEGRQ